MIEHFESICYQLFSPTGKADPLPVFNPAQQFTDESDEPADIARQLNAAFLILLAGSKHPQFKKAQSELHRATRSDEWSKIAQFYLSAVDRIRHEIEETAGKDPDLADRLKSLSHFLEKEDQGDKASQTTENIWKLFFPEGVGLAASPEDAIDRLRQKRAVTITHANPQPILDPAAEILFSSNVLLTLPPASLNLDHLPFSDNLKQKLQRASREPQLYWYDHPIHIGVQPPNNELLYGLRGLEEAVKFECQHGSTAKDARMTCILSVSVTHQGLHQIARPYIEEELRRADFLKHIDVYVFTEDDTHRIINDVLVAAARQFLKITDAVDELAMFGVDGEYGRHYSFLKAIVRLRRLLSAGRKTRPICCRLSIARKKAWPTCTRTG